MLIVFYIIGLIAKKILGNIEEEANRMYAERVREEEKRAREEEERQIREQEMEYAEDSEEEIQSRIN